MSQIEVLSLACPSYLSHRTSSCPQLIRTTMASQSNSNVDVIDLVYGSMVDVDGITTETFEKGPQACQKLSTAHEPIVGSVLSLRQEDSSISLLGSTIDSTAAICSSRRHNNAAAPHNQTSKSRSNLVEMGISSIVCINENDSLSAVTPKSEGMKGMKDKKSASAVLKERVSRPAQKRRGATNFLQSVEVGDAAPDFELEDMMGVRHKLSSYRGRKILLSFFRFAACHGCLYNINTMRRQYDMLKKAGIVIICIFNSTPENIERFASQTLGEPLLALSDKKGMVYHSYKVNESSKKTAVLGGMGSFLRWKKYKNYIKVAAVRDMSMSGMRIIPADFLINEDGIIVDMFRSESPEGGSIPFERLEAFIPEDKRCKCNKMDCISPKCRCNYVEQVARENMALKGLKENARHTAVHEAKPAEGPNTTVRHTISA